MTDSTYLKRDPRFIEIFLRPLRPFFRHVFRVEVEGLQDIPSAPCVFVANHNIGAAVEISALLDAWQARYPGRAVYGLAHPFAFRIPGLKQIVSRMGAVPATYDCAYEALNSGASLIIFPGGNEEAVRPFCQRNISDFGNHSGWAKIALKAKRQVVPISIVGSHTLNPVLLRSRWLASALVIPRLVLGLKYFPVTVSQLVWSAAAFMLARSFLPLWASILISFFEFIFTALHPIWPGKIKIRFGKAIDLEGLTVEAAYVRVSANVQEGMDLLLKK